MKGDGGLGYPKIKHAMLCRILVYLVVIGGFSLPVAIAFSLDFLSDDLKMLMLMVTIIGLGIYIWKNLVVLMGMDLYLAMIHCHQTARKFFVLRDSFSSKKAKKRLSHFGRSFSVSSHSPQPEIFRYRKIKSMTMYADHIEKYLLVFCHDFLDKEAYLSVIASAKANVRIFEEKNKFLQKGRSTKKQTSDRVTVIVIFAKAAEDRFVREFTDDLCKKGSNDFDVSVLPCVVILDSHRCIFDSERLPYNGMKYPVKNRGIRMIRRYLFGGFFPYSISTAEFEPLPEYDEESSLWHFWRTLIKEERMENKSFKKNFKKMEHQEIRFDGDYIYLKWNDRGVWLAVKISEDQKLAEIDAVDMWIYPKTNKISKATIKEINDLIRSYFKERGYSVRFVKSE